MTKLPWRRIGIVLGLSVFTILILFFDPVPDRPEVGNMAAVAALMAVLWITEAVPLAATALIPVIMLLRLVNHRAVVDTKGIKLAVKPMLIITP